MTYPSTTMRGDGPVVSVPFRSYAVEVIPAFRVALGKYYICDTHEGGRYKLINPRAEMRNLQTSNDLTLRKTRDLIRMMKRWQDYCNVPLKSFQIELLVIEFLKTWKYSKGGIHVYGWMVRDFLADLVGKAGSFLFVPGTNEPIFVSEDWKSRAETAYARALKACFDESAGKAYDAGVEWQKIFGTYVPIG